MSTVDEVEEIGAVVQVYRCLIRCKLLRYFKAETLASRNEHLEVKTLEIFFRWETLVALYNNAFYANLQQKISFAELPKSADTIMTPTSSSIDVKSKK